MTFEQSDTAKLTLKEVSYTIQDGDNHIKAVASTLNGKEYIFFNDKKIIENRNFGFSSKYAYEEAGHVYEFRFIMTLRSAEFLALKDDHMIYSETITLKNQQKIGFWAGLAFGIAGAITGYSMSALFLG